MNRIIEAISYFPILTPLNSFGVVRLSTTEKIITVCKNIFILLTSLSLSTLALNLLNLSPYALFLREARGRNYYSAGNSLMNGIQNLTAFAVVVFSGLTWIDMSTSKLITAARQEKRDRMLIQEAMTALETNNHQPVLNAAHALLRKPDTLIPIIQKINDFVSEQFFNLFMNRIEPTMKHMIILEEFDKKGMKLNKSHFNNFFKLLQSHDGYFKPQLNAGLYTEEEQVLFWANAADSNISTRHLVDSGFDINAKIDGKTAFSLLTEARTYTYTEKTTLQNLIAAGAEKPENFSDDEYEALIRDVKMYTQRTTKSARKS